jgi:hypothetical protein
MVQHSAKVANVCQQIRERAKHPGLVKLQKGMVSHFVPNPYDTRHKLPKVDISDLNQILEIDDAKMTCVAEPGVTFSDLVKATMEHGLIPYTVPELKGITIGGAVSGCSIESMSYRYGGFHDSCLEYEVIDGRGQPIRCSHDENSDIFHMIHGSYGTLGILSKIKFKLMPAKPFVHMTYLKFDNFEEYWACLQERCSVGDYDFVDSIIHSREEFVICLGRMTDYTPHLSDYSWMEIFYKSTNLREEDYLTLYDYFFRYDTECHWLTKTVPLMETKPARFLFGKQVLGSTNLIKWSNRLKSIMKLKKRPEVVVDVFIPEMKFQEFYEWYESSFQFFPLWIVPYRAPQVYPWVNDVHAKKMEGQMLIDCAVYGKPNNNPEVDYSEVLEKKTIELGGFKTLISRNHFDRESFWKVYNQPRYKSMKHQLDPKNLFNDLYEKFHPGT